MERMEPDEFWNLFKTRFDAWWKTDTEKKLKAFNNPAMRTCQMIPFLVEMGQNDGDYYVETEAYPHIDVGYYSEMTKGDWHEWSFEIAIEHENGTHPKWQDECSKLMQLNAGLKVLVSYHDGDTAKLAKQLGEFSGIYRSRKYHQEDDKYLFIFIPLNDFEHTEKFSVYRFIGDGDKIELVQQPHA